MRLWQAPEGGGPFLVSGERLPEMVASLNRVSTACKVVANLFIGVGSVLIAIKAVRGALSLWQRRKRRRATSQHAYERFIDMCKRQLCQ